MLDKTCVELMQADLEYVCRALQPCRVAAFELPDVSALPLAALVENECSTTFVDANVGRIETLLAEHVARIEEGRPCLACEPGLDGADVCANYKARSTEEIECQTLLAIPRDPARCNHFVPGRRLRVINGDARRGRSAAFTTRVETLVAAASTPAVAVENALHACQQAADLDVRLPLPDGLFDLVISAFAPTQLVEIPYGYFDQVMTRRFGPWTESLRNDDAIERLRLALFQRQLGPYVAELARVTEPIRGRLYFATIPLEASDEGWLLERGVTECFEALSRWFAFDFETFAPESFLRYCPHRKGVIQTALLRRKQTTQGAP